MTDVVLVQPIAEAGIALLEEAGLSVHRGAGLDLAQLSPHLATAQAVITRDAGLSAAAIAAAPALRVIVSHGTGTATIDKAAAAARGIPVLNTPGTNAQSVAEMALGLMLACARHLIPADTAVRAGNWGFRHGGGGFELAGRTLGLVGFGHVARRLVPLAQAFGMPVQGWSRHAGPDILSAAGITAAASLDHLLETSDVVSLHATPDAGCLLDAMAIQRMKPGALLINTARGALVDETALAQALQSRHLAGAGLDVFGREPLPKGHPLLGAPHVVLAPHMGGATAEALDRTAVAAARAVLTALA